MVMEAVAVAGTESEAETGEGRRGAAANSAVTAFETWCHSRKKNQGFAEKNNFEYSMSEGRQPWEWFVYKLRLCIHRKITRIFMSRALWKRSRDDSVFNPLVTIPTFSTPSDHDQQKEKEKDKKTTLEMSFLVGK